MRRSKAISPMIAIVLLIAFTVAVAGILITWGTGLLGTTTGAVESGTEYKIKCSTVLLQLKNIKYYGDTRNGLVGYWKFDDGSGSSTAIDSSGYGNNGTLNPTTVGQDKWVAGNVSNALNFDGSNDYVNVGNLGNPETSNMTWEFWFKSPTCGHRAILAKRVSSVTFYYIKLWSTGIECAAKNGGTTIFNFISNHAWCDNKWHHGVLARTSGDATRLYIDGIEDGSSSDTVGSLAFSTSLNIGQSGGSSWYFSGAIDETRVYNRTLNGTEINMSYQQGLKGLPSNVSAYNATGAYTLVGYWALNESGTNNTATDSSLNGRTGTLYGYPPEWTTDCKFGNCLKFDKVDDYVVIGDKSVLEGMTSLTLMAWVKPLGSENGRVIVSKGVGLYQFQLNGRKPCGYINTYDIGCASGASSPPENEWTHVALVYDTVANTSTFYINGTGYASTYKTNGQPIGVNSYNFDIGADPAHLCTTGNFYCFNGTIDDVRIYNRALSAGEIQDDYQYQSFIRGLLLHTGGAESVNNATITAAGGGYVNTTTAFATSAFDPGSGYSFTINTTGGVSTAPDIISVTAKCGNIGISVECTPGQGCMSSG